MMRIRMLLMVGMAALLFAAAPTKAQYYWDRFEVTPFVGYETQGSYPLNPSLSTVNAVNLRVEGGTSFGTFLDFSITRNAQLEFMYNRNQTNYDIQQFAGGVYTKAYNSDIDQFQFGGNYALLSREHRLRPYIAGSVGFTHEFNSGLVPNRLDFGFSVGGGVKYQISRHIGFRGDARYMPTYANSSLATYCDPFFGCYLARVRNYQSRGNFVGGIIFSF